jgi:4'-phosphopantetheinyl transferase EntD
MREIAKALSALLPGAGVGWADPRVTQPGDQPHGATEIRRCEFAAGRAAAAQALSAFGVADPVPAGPDRAPIWPTGLSGSITHTREVALAIVVQGGTVGIDLEPEGAATPDLWPEILLPEELPLAEATPALATAIFCAKEAVYKAQYPTTRLLFGFDRLAITLGPTTFTARFTAPTGSIAQGTEWTGHLIRAQGHVLALCRP